MSDYNGTPELYSIDSDGQDRQLISYSMNETDRYHVVSPDQTRIAFLSARDGRFWDIYIMQMDGSNLHRLTISPIPETTLAWTPDGNGITFGSGRGIEVLKLDGNTFSVVSRSGVDGEPAWSPDASRIAFSSEGKHIDQRGVYIFDMKSQQDTYITAKANNASSPTWSPDGSSIAFVINEGSGDQIYVENSGGSYPHELTSDTNCDHISPHWKPT